MHILLSQLPTNPFNGTVISIEGLGDYVYNKPNQTYQKNPLVMVKMLLLCNYVL